MLDTVFFAAFATVIVFGALATILLRNPVHCAAGLMTALTGIAGIFLLAGAEFLSVAQIIVYVGGVLLLFVFVLMLVNVRAAEQERRFNKNAGISFTLALLGGAWVVWLLSTKPLVLPPAAIAVPGPEGNTGQLGNALFTTYLLPFEIASVLLLASLIGSVVLARKRD